MNFRPLTYVSFEELLEPLTLSHLLCGPRLITLPDVPAKEEDTYIPTSEDTNCLTRRMKFLTRTLENLCSRWKKEYLLELRSLYRSTKGDGPHLLRMTVGDVIIMEDGKTPRGFWRLGVITELLVGRDG